MAGSPPLPLLLPLLLLLLEQDVPSDGPRRRREERGKGEAVHSFFANVTMAFQSRTLYLSLSHSLSLSLPHIHPQADARTMAAARMRYEDLRIND